MREDRLLTYSVCLSVLRPADMTRQRGRLRHEYQ
jgi:hypothetical protein